MSDRSSTPRRKLKRTLPAVLAALTVGLSAHRVAEANGGGVHIGSLSDTASYAVIGAFVAVVGLFVLMFVLRWSASIQSEQLGHEDALDIESEDEV